MQLTEEDERAFEQLWRRVGLSVDWSNVYRTISEASRATAQRMFLKNLARGEAYAQEAPTLWDITFGPPSPRPSWRTGSAPAPTTGSFAGLPAPSSSRRPGPS